MAKFKIVLNRTSIDECELIVEAPNAEEAGNKAIDDNIGTHEWEYQETIDISVATCEEM